MAGLAASGAHAQLGPTGTQWWNQSSAGIGVAIEAAAWFGYGIASGDFDCDGFDDLAIGMPGEDLVGGDNAGRLIVLYGSASGITADDNQVWGQNSPVILDDAEPNDRFGQVLAVGDFDINGCDDLAIGVPLENIGNELNAGAVNVIYGSASGLTGTNDDFWHQDLATIEDDAESGDFFGAALAVGDFNDDGVDDLAIGVPGENLDVDDAGMVHVLFGSIFGLVAGNSVALVRGDNIAGAQQEDERIGGALATGNFVILAGDELAIGAVGHDVGGNDQAGAVYLISDIDGLVFDSVWTQATAGVPGVAEDFDRFGEVLAAGDFDGDGIDELAVGVPDEDRENPLIGSIGAVNVLDFDDDGHQIWTQDDLPPEAEGLNEQFGGALVAADFDADGIDDLAIAAPLEDLGPIGNTGLLHVLYGESGDGLTADRDQIWIQTIDPSQHNDEFGFSLAAGYFAGHSGADLAIGAPGETIGAFTSTGAVNLIYSEALFLDGFESGDTSTWSNAVGD